MERLLKIFLDFFGKQKKPLILGIMGYGGLNPPSPINKMINPKAEWLVDLLYILLGMAIIIWIGWVNVMIALLRKKVKKLQEKIIPKQLL